MVFCITIKHCCSYDELLKHGTLVIVLLCGEVAFAPLVLVLGKGGMMHFGLWGWMLAKGTYMTIRAAEFRALD